VSLGKVQQKIYRLHYFEGKGEMVEVRAHRFIGNNKGFANPFWSKVK